MNVLVAISAAMDITNAALILLAKAQQVNALVSKAQAEGRDITTVEMDSIIREDDAARVALNAAILAGVGK